MKLKRCQCLPHDSPIELVILSTFRELRDQTHVPERLLILVYLNRDGFLALDHALDLNHVKFPVVGKAALHVREEALRAHLHLQGRSVMKVWKAVVTPMM